MDSDTKELFKVFHLLFKKPYNLNSELAIQKYRVFKDNVRDIKEHNAKKLSWWAAINEYSDLTYQEFRNHFNLKPRSEKEMEEYIKKQTRFLGNEINFDEEADKEEVLTPSPNLSDVSWASQMGPIRDQGQCGDCWAFSTMGALEGVYAIKNKKVTPWISTQQLVDCDTVDNGCNGGWQGNAYTYLIKNGAMLDSKYPYTATKSTCKYNKNEVSYTVKSVSSCSNCSLTAWRTLLESGPVAVCIDASSKLFNNYGGGVLNPSQMGCGSLDHAVVAYAWASTGNGVISVRNSWGTSWGIKGNFEISYTSGDKSTCWITYYAFLPVIA